MQAERSPDAKDINGAEEDFPQQITELKKKMRCPKGRDLAA